MQLSVAVTATMSSREIAELTGKTLSHVNRDVLIMLKDLHPEINPELDDYDSIGVFVKKEVYKGRNIIGEILLNKEHTECLITGYSAVLRMKVIKRLNEIEGAGRVPQSLPEALRLAADLAEQKLELENKLSIAAPKAKFVDSYVQATGLMGFREVAKLLKIKETEFREFLIDNSIMYRLAGKMTPYANHIDAGRFEVKTGENQDNGRAYTQAKFTPKGVEWIAGLIAVDKIKDGIK